MIGTGERFGLPILCGISFRFHDGIDLVLVWLIETIERGGAVIEVKLMVGW
jgi:hypothetical protein